MWVVFEIYPQSDVVRIPTWFGRVSFLVVDKASLDVEHSLVESILLERLAAVETLHKSADKQPPALCVIILH